MKRKFTSVVIVDRFGKLLATSDDSKGRRLDPKDTLVVLTKLLAAQAVQ